MSNPETSTPDLPPNTIREHTQAKYSFTVEELAALGSQLSHSFRDKARVESELDSIKQDYKTKISTIELAQDNIRRKLDDGFEMRDAAAMVTFNDPDSGRKTYRHEGSGEVIRTDLMTASDFQLPMFRNPDGKDATEPDGKFFVGNEEVDPETLRPFLDTESGEGTREDLGRIEDVPGAGQTSVGDALNSAAVQTEQPQIVIANWGLEDWKLGALRKAFRIAANKVGWPEAAISPIDEALKGCDSVEAAKELLRPHVVNGNDPSLKDLMDDARAAVEDIGDLKAVFSDVIRLYPSKYPGGSHEGNFDKFQADVKASMEAK